MTSKSPSATIVRLARLALPALVLLALLAAGTSAQAQRLRLREALAMDDGTDDDARAEAPAGTRVLRDLAYGPDAAQRLDVYLPNQAPAPGSAPMPVILFVHGGGWARGDKAMHRVVDPKVGHWVGRGWAVVSIDYRMLPTPVATQEDDVAAALAFAQAQAPQWGADPKRFVLMGHSAGAHLVALLAAGARTPSSPHLQPWRGAVFLDSAALDLPFLMTHRHLRLYDRAFGSDASTWTALSPLAVLQAPAAPVLAVCSTRRTESCMDADRFAAKARSLGGQARVLREDLSHGEINATLGAPSDYTGQVDAFLDSLR
ncbi:MAG TPA: alpha/beta hydrolase [Burkholderiaceae bacterium]